MSLPHSVSKRLLVGNFWEDRSRMVLYRDWCRMTAAERKSTAAEEIVRITIRFSWTKHGSMRMNGELRDSETEGNYRSYIGVLSYDWVVASSALHSIRGGEFGGGCSIHCGVLSFLFQQRSAEWSQPDRRSNFAHSDFLLRSFASTKALQFPDRSLDLYYRWPDFSTATFL